MSKKAPARERILDTAARLFQQRGYKEVGINEIIEASGTAKASFYSNFKSKEKLGEAWLQRVHDASEASLSQLLEEMSDPRIVLDGYFADLATFLKKGNFRGCPYTNTGAVITPEESCLLSQIHEHKDFIRAFFRNLAAKRQIVKEASDRLGDQLFILYSGATTEAQNLQSLWPVEVARETALHLWDTA